MSTAIYHPQVPDFKTQPRLETMGLYDYGHALQQLMNQYCYETGVAGGVRENEADPALMNLFDIDACIDPEILLESSRQLSNRLSPAAQNIIPSPSESQASSPAISSSTSEPEVNFNEIRDGLFGLGLNVEGNNVALIHYPNYVTGSQALPVFPERRMGPPKMHCIKPYDFIDSCNNDTATTNGSETTSPTTVQLKLPPVPEDGYNMDYVLELYALVLQGAYDPNHPLFIQVGESKNGGVKRPMNSFTFYRRCLETKIRAEFDSKKEMGQASKKVSEEWKALPPQDKAIYNTFAEVHKKKFLSAHKGYKFPGPPGKGQAKKESRNYVADSLNHMDGYGYGVPHMIPEQYCAFKPHITDGIYSPGVCDGQWPSEYYCPLQ